MVNEYCIGCIHLDTDLMACVYILHTGRSRAFTMMQPGGTGCTCREAGNSKRGQRAVISDEIRACMIQKYEKEEQRRESIKRLHADGLTDTQIARETGCTASAVKHWRKVNSLPANRKRDSTSAALTDMYAKGYTDKQMAERLGLPPSRVSNWRSTKGLLPNAPVKEETNDNK